MQKVSGSKHTGIQDKKKNEKRVQSLGNRDKEEEEEEGEGEENKAIGREAENRQRPVKSTFVHTVSCNYQCYIQYVRDLLLSSKTIERIHN